MMIVVRVIFLQRKKISKLKKPLLQEVIESMGHKVIFYSKFHPELNFIEKYWGAAKRYTQQHCDHTWNGLKETLPSVFDFYRRYENRKYALRSKRFMEGIGGTVGRICH